MADMELAKNASPVRQLPTAAQEAQPTPSEPEVKVAALQGPDSQKLCAMLEQSIATKLEAGRTLLEEAQSQAPGRIKRLAINDSVEPALDTFFSNIPKCINSLGSIQQSFAAMFAQARQGLIPMSAMTSAVEAASRDADNLLKFAEHFVGGSQEKLGMNEKLNRVNNMTPEEQIELSTIHTRLAQIAERYSAPNS